ncbi:hypothetical protein [Halosegnis sp.]|uniref:hypothetical protein n=1 Tax=Halosegnis sp. TaxID=2864959 RepID=UPI0035D3F288
MRLPVGPPAQLPVVATLTQLTDSVMLATGQRRLAATNPRSGRLAQQTTSSMPVQLPGTDTDTDYHQ